MEQDELLRHAITTLNNLQIPHMLVGSFASMIHGEPRMTQDIDIVVDLKPRQIPALCDAFPEPDFYLSRQAVVDAVRDGFQFNVLHPESGNKIDFILPRPDEWGRKQLERRQSVELAPGLTGWTASAEDVILGKLWYYSEGGSEKHLRDIAGIVRVRGDALDLAYLDSWAEQLGFAEPWLAVKQRLDEAS